MIANRNIPISTKVFLYATFIATCFFLSACSTEPQFPEDAREALTTYWLGLPSKPGITHQITRAWPSAAPAEEITPWAPTMEVWCVEAEMSSPDDPALDGELVKWIVLRDNEDASWTAAMLATLSSSWPYAACGEDT